MKIVKMKSDYSQCKCIDFKHYLAANLQYYIHMIGMGLNSSLLFGVLVKYF